MSNPQSPADHPLRPDIPAQAQGSPSTAMPWPTPTPAPYTYAEALPSSFEPELDEPYAQWWQRVVARLIDAVLQIPFLIVQFVGLAMAVDGGGVDWTGKSGFAFWLDPIKVTNANLSTGATLAGLGVSSLGSLGLLIFVWWNTIFRQGRRGASLGKACMNLMVVSEADGRPVGALMTWVRSWVHLLDLIVLGLGYLWPLWDRKRQTFADMIMRTAVLHLPPLPLPAPAPQIPAQAGPPHGW